MRSKLTVFALLLSAIVTLCAIPLLARTVKDQSVAANRVLAGELPADFEYINGFITTQGKFAQLRTRDQRARIDIAIAPADAKCSDAGFDLAQLERACLEPVLSKFLLAQVDPKRARQILPINLALGSESITAASFELPDRHFYWLAQRRNTSNSSLLLAHTREKALSTEEFRQILQALHTTF